MLLLRFCLFDNSSQIYLSISSSRVRCFDLWVVKYLPFLMPISVSCAHSFARVLFWNVADWVGCPLIRTCARHDIVPFLLLRFWKVAIYLYLLIYIYKR